MKNITTAALKSNAKEIGLLFLKDFIAPHTSMPQINAQKCANIKPKIGITI